MLSWAPPSPGESPYIPKAPAPNFPSLENSRLGFFPPHTWIIEFLLSQIPDPLPGALPQNIPQISDPNKRPWLPLFAFLVNQLCSSTSSVFFQEEYSVQTPQLNSRQSSGFLWNQKKKKKTTTQSAQNIFDHPKMRWGSFQAKGKNQNPKIKSWTQPLWEVLFLERQNQILSSAPMMHARKKGKFVF